MTNPLETAIRLSNQSVSQHWHCKPTTVKNSCRILSESSNTATGYLGKAAILNHTAEVGHILPGEPGVLSFCNNNAFSQQQGM